MATLPKKLEVAEKYGEYEITNELREKINEIIEYLSKIPVLPD